MQGLTDAPRTATPAGDVKTLLTSAPNITVGAGLEMLIYERDGSLGRSTLAPFPLDVTDILIPEGSSVAYDNTAKIGGTATLQLDPDAWTALGNPVSLRQAFAAPTANTIDQVDYRLYWGNPRTRLRPYMTLSSPSVPTVSKFYLGCYVPASPSAPIDSAPVYAVTCYDQTAIFDVPIPTSMSYLAGTNVVTTVQAIIANFDLLLITESPLIVVTDPTLTYQLLPQDQAFVIGQSTWLDVINALLNSAGYNNLWADYLGQLHISLYVDPRTRTPEYVMDATDPVNGIVDPTGTWQPNIWNVPNQWIFTNSLITGVPVEGNGQYTYTNQSGGPTSIDKQRGRVITAYGTLAAVDQSALMRQATAQIVQDSAIGETWTINTAPLPIAGFQDVIQLISNNVETNLFAAAQTQTRLCITNSWSLPLDGSDMTWNWGTIG